MRGMVELAGGDFLFGSDDEHAYPDGGKAPSGAVAARQANSPDTSTGGLGFRCIAAAHEPSADGGG